MISRQTPVVSTDVPKYYEKLTGIIGDFEYVLSNLEPVGGKALTKEEVEEIIRSLCFKLKEVREKVERMDEVKEFEDFKMDKHWCMCTKLQAVLRDGWSTCSICGGKDAYGLSEDRPPEKKKIIEEK